MADKANGQQAAPGAPAQTLSKSQAVRLAMKALGMSATRGQIKAYAQKKFGMDLDPDHISSISSDLRRLAKNQQAPATKAAKPAASAPTAKAAVTKTPTKPTPADKGIPGVSLSVADVQAVKALVERLGAAQLKGLIDVLTR